jgi:hypothetical protein
MHLETDRKNYDSDEPKTQPPPAKRKPMKMQPLTEKRKPTKMHKKATTTGAKNTTTIRALTQRNNIVKETKQPTGISKNTISNNTPYKSCNKVEL